MKLKTILALCPAVCLLGGTAQATFSFNTGVDAGGGVDANWTLASVNPASAPGGEAPPNAFIASDGAPTYPFPFNGYWVHNDSTSKWITYSTPLYTGGDSGRTFDYQLTFTVSSPETIQVRWLSDNNSDLWLDGVNTGTLIGSRAPASAQNYNTFNAWNNYIPVNLSAGTHTFDVMVDNIGQSSDNPTGMRFEAVPEPTTVLAGALLLLPFGASTIRGLRRKA